MPPYIVCVLVLGDLKLVASLLDELLLESLRVARTLHGCAYALFSARELAVSLRLVQAHKCVCI